MEVGRYLGEFRWAVGGRAFGGCFLFEEEGCSSVCDGLGGGGAAGAEVH